MLGESVGGDAERCRCSSALALASWKEGWMDGLGLSWVGCVGCGGVGLGWLGLGWVEVEGR